jgi:hypothetical protein
VSEANPNKCLELPASDVGLRCAHPNLREACPRRYPDPEDQAPKWAAFFKAGKSRRSAGRLLQDKKACRGGPAFLKTGKSPPKRAAFLKTGKAHRSGRLSSRQEKPTEAGGFPQDRKKPTEAGGFPQDRKKLTEAGNASQLR